VILRIRSWKETTDYVTEITNSAYGISGMHYFLILSGWYQILVALQALVKESHQGISCLSVHCLSKIVFFFFSHYYLKYG